MTLEELPKSKILIREAERKDVQTLVNLWREQHNYHLNLDPDYYEPTSDEVLMNAQKYFDAAIEKGSLQILLAENQSKPVGFITFEKVSRSPGIARSGTLIKDYGEVVDLFITEVERGKGFGEQLMKKAEEKLKQQGVTHFMVEVSASNPKTIEFYKRGGYTTKQVEMFKEI
ncbi:MAG: GNAT family N-acetyltransferase [Candidatus Beckwithbacteria bacterium]